MAILLLELTLFHYQTIEYIILIMIHSQKCFTKCFIDLFFSICNLAVTSVYLRQVCSALLDVKGCVTLQWERVNHPKLGFQWSVAYKRWFFSTSLGPIDHWAISAQLTVSEHLKKCPFNVRTQHKDVKTLDQNWPKVMEALDKRLSEKRDSVWFIQ